MVRALLCCAIALSAACTAPGPLSTDISQAELLSGAALPAKPPAGAPLPPEDVFELDAEMRDFVARHTGNTRDQAAKLRRLLTGMKEEGLFALDYDETLTHTARGTFYARSGNCLSFTILFVALAREAGLDARYQAVDIPPGWSREADLIVVTNHVNAIVDMRSGQQFVVDFNIGGYRSDREQRVVDDSYVIALFYNNLGAEALIRGDFDTSFQYLRAALATSPELTDPWVNLGVLYRRQGHIEHAEAAYLHALTSNPRDGSALSNLANLEAYLGNEAAAAHYREQIRRHQNRNPYYHYFLAREALDQRRFDDARAALKQAQRLKSNEPAFDELRAALNAAAAGMQAGPGGAAAEDVARSVAEVTPVATP